MMFLVGRDGLGEGAKVCMRAAQKQEPGRTPNRDRPRTSGRAKNKERGHRRAPNSTNVEKPTRQRGCGTIRM
jgi:hypothetical protein